MHRQDRKCPCAAILITEISVCDNRLGISRQCSKLIAGVDRMSLLMTTGTARVWNLNPCIYHSVMTCRQTITNSTVSAPPNATKITVKKVSDVSVSMFWPVSRFARVSGLRV